MKPYWKKKRVLAGGGLVLCLLIFHFIPLPETLKHKPQANLLLAENGELLAAKIAADHQWRFPATKNLPLKYLVAVTTFEDKYFYRHPGVNPFSLLRAAKSNYLEKHIVSGGSTITMQVARLMRGDPPRTYINKCIEIFLALKLEWHYSKAEIISMYASNAPLGGNTVGIAAASWRYFGRNLNDACCDESGTQLTWAEAALLAVLPNSPALIHPGRGREKLKRKRDNLLEQLFNDHRLSENEYRLSVLEPLPGKPHSFPKIASHLLQTLLDKNPQDVILHSTLDADLQRKLLELGNFSGKHLQSEGIHNLSIVVIDNVNLRTRAYIGNITHAENIYHYGSDVDIATKSRSTGSILKPFLYALMLQDGKILPGTLIPDVPTNYSGFTPENYDHEYRGAVPAKHALAQSLNIPAVRMLKNYGITRFYDELKQSGLSTLFRSADDYGLSLILGGAEGNLWELTSINARLVNVAREGWKADAAREVQTIVDQIPKPTNFAINQGAAWLTLDALINVARPDNESAWRDFSGSQKIAWKTGTSYGLRDAWAIGNNGQYTVGVWAGNAGGEGVAGLSGLHSAAPVLFQTFNILGSSTWISKPEFALKSLLTCDDDGYLANGKCATRISYAPKESHFQKISPFHQKINLDVSQTFQVHGGCEKVGNMISANWLVLPPLQELYWKPWHSEYKSLPPWREDCIADLANFTDNIPMEIAYPLAGSKIYIPVELNSEKGRVVFKASHRNPNSTLYWHIDNNFIEETTLFHDVALDIAPGWHKLIVVDESGFRLERWFEVLNKDV